MTEKDWSAFRSTKYLNNASFHNSGQASGGAGGVEYWTNGLATLHQADARALPLADKSVHCVVTSPPYWGLRDYGLGEWEGGDADCDHAYRASSPRDHDASGGKLAIAKQTYPGGICGKCGARQQATGIGLEPTLGEWLANIVAVGREVWRVLRDDGTFWLNLGDAYSSGNGGDGGRGHENGGVMQKRRREGDKSLPAKNLMGQPWRAAFALQDWGWVLRSAVVWHKPNPMPESVTDRPTSAYEMVFLLTKQGRYFYDAEAVRQPHDDKAGPPSRFGNVQYEPKQVPAGVRSDFNHKGYRQYHPSGANLRNVWTIPTQGRPEAHFATFPDELPRRCILAGTSAHGVCATCGAPWVRVLKMTDEYKAVLDSGKAWRDDAGKPDGFTNRHPSTHPSQVPAKNQTLGWQPTCACDAARCEVHGNPQRSAVENSKYTDDYNAASALSNLQARRKAGIPDDEGWGKQTTGWQASCQCEANRVPATVLDPFIGSGTTAAVALALGRKAVGTDLNAEYLEIARKRIGKADAMPMEML